MLMNTYNRFPVTFARGEGCTLYDDTGKAYVDFASGIGVNSVGHAHPQWVKAITEQAGLLAHVSNLYHTLPAEQLAQKLVELSGLANASVFFANSGAEANEGMIKLARKYSRDKYGENRSTIVTLNRSFHGRTITTLAATGQDVFHRNFMPFTEGFVHVPPEDIEILSAMDEDVCAVMLEPIQGEGGVIPLSAEYMEALAKLAAERDWLLLFDEVQTGVGRTGKWFAFQHTPVTPDVFSFAKGIAGGLPLGGFVAAEKCANVLKPGDHATTFGGNPVCCAAALATLEILQGVLAAVTPKGELIKNALKNIPWLKEVRGAGLMLGATVDTTRWASTRALAERLLANGLVCLTAGGDALRLMPPLVISEQDINKGLAIIAKID